ncbi:hypothetical protein [Leptospira levettii]|uniref:hypothetical protein n=1 Tax=Leptospira levettii TaxID=2023178 RepID=UPI000C2ABAF7|nr:hypothetical protein [Leptospira levettii]PJZ89521.1 hypothetical protein CH368_06065 [Leptospira levettii]
MTYAERIPEGKDINGNETYLYCGINSNPEDYAKEFDSSEEAIEGLREKIWNNCLLRRYSQEQTDKVLAYYQEKFSKATVVWKKETKVYYGKDVEGNDVYLYCSVSSNPEDYVNKFNSPTDAFESIREPIWREGLKREYTGKQIDTIINHYYLKFAGIGSSLVWKKEESEE